MSFNNNPLEKQLLHLDLSKGINERDRAETADPATCLTQADNLLQNQAGAYEKRTGLYPLTQPPVGITAKILRLRSGLGVIDDSANFYQFQESTGELKDRGTVNDFSLTAENVSSLGAFGVNSGSFGCSSQVSCTAFHAIAVGRYLELYDRESGAVVARYNINLAIGVPSLVSQRTYLAFVGDRYLHVHTVGYAGVGGISDVYSFIIDTANSLPSTTAAMTTTVTSLITSGLPIVQDVSVGPDASYLLVLTDDIPIVPYFIKCDNSGTIIRSVAPDDTRAISYSSYDTNLWYVSGGEFGYYDTVALAPGAAGVSVGFGEMPVLLGNNIATGLLVDNDGYAWLAYEKVTTMDTGKTCMSVRLWRTYTPGDTTMGGVVGTYATLQSWRLASAPFEAMVGPERKVFAHLTKDVFFDTVSDLSTPVPHVLASIKDSEVSILSNVDSVFVQPYYSVPLAAMVEPNLGVRGVGGDQGYGYIQKVFPSTTGLTQFSVLVPTLTSPRSLAYMVVTARTDRQTKRGTVVFGGANYISGGAHLNYGGSKQPHEVGFADMPKLAAVPVTPGLQSYRYIAVYRYVDETGAVTWSRCSDIQSALVDDIVNGIRLTVSPPCVTLKDSGAIPSGASIHHNYPGPSVELYRTLVGGTQFYLCSTAPDLNLGVVDGFYRVTDTMTDAVLATKAQLFRQPGTPNSAVDRYPPPAGNIICQHKDRLFTSDPLGVRVYYSSFFVDGETAWYNPQFSFFVHGGTGPITGIASMDGRLFIFKRDCIFVVDGDGPAEGGVTGNEYSPPQRLATEHGCVDHRTLVVTTEGLMYRSPRGIELLTRSLQVKYIGERVQNLVDSLPYNHGACMDTDGRMHMLLGSAANAALREVVYDFTSDCWTTSTFITYGYVDLCLADLKTYGEVVIMAQESGYIMRTTSPADGIYYDVPYSVWNPWTLETGWIRTGQQVRARFSKILALLKNNADSNYKLTCTVSISYANATVQTATWDAETLSTLDVAELEVQLSRQEVLAVRFKMVDGPPTDTTTYPVGTCRGADILGISVEVAPKAGAPKGPAGQKA